MSDVSKLRILYVLEPNGIREATNEECLERVRWRKDADPSLVSFSSLLAVARGVGLDGTDDLERAAIVQAMTDLANELAQQDRMAERFTGDDVSDLILGRVNDVRTAMAPK